MLITTLYPRNRFNYDFDVNKPWKYENLYSPFKFTINKSQDSIDAEKSRLLSDFYPYYVFDENAHSQVITNFLQNFGGAFIESQGDSTLNFTSKDSIYFIERLAQPMLDTIYEAGIFDTDEDVLNFANKSPQINLVRQTGQAWNW